MSQDRSKGVSEELSAAYVFISEFKNAGSAIDSPEARKLIRLLSEDLGLLAEQHPFEELVDFVVQADSRWNRRAQELANEYYVLIEQGYVIKANELRAEFIRLCPSAWYCEIAEAL
jgi:hypothetical protein